MDNVQERDMRSCLEPFNRSTAGSKEFYTNFCSLDLCATEDYLRGRRGDLERSTVREAIAQRLEELRLRRLVH